MFDIGLSLKKCYACFIMINAIIKNVMENIFLVESVFGVVVQQLNQIRF